MDTPVLAEQQKLSFISFLGDTGNGLEDVTKAIGQLMREGELREYVLLIRLDDEVHEE